MSREDVELVRRLHEAWLAGDRETALAGVDPGIEWVQPPDSPEPGTDRGPEGIERSMAEWTQPFEDYAFEIHELREVGEGQVLVCLHQHGRVQGSTLPVRGTTFFLWTVRDGRAVRVEMFRTEREAIGAASRPTKRA